MGKVNEEQLREAIRKIIAENMEDVNDTVYSRDDGDLEVDIATVEGEEEAAPYSLGADASAEEMLALVARYVEEKGIETAPPGMTDAGIRDTQNYLKGDWGRGKKNAAAKAAAAADFAADGPEVEVEEEEAVVGEALVSLVKESRRRRRRRAAAIKAQRERAAAQTPVAAVAPSVKKEEPAKEKKEVPAGNRPPSAKPKKVVKENTDKGWYEDELFTKLLKEAVK